MDLMRFRMDCGKVNSCCVVAPAWLAGIDRIKKKNQLFRLVNF